jgi:hypothetical protein
MSFFLNEVKEFCSDTSSRSIDSGYIGDEEEGTISLPNGKNISINLDHRSGSEISSKVVSLPNRKDKSKKRNDVTISSTQNHLGDVASSKFLPLLLKDLPLPISEKARQLVSLLDSSMMESDEQADTRDLQRNDDISRNSSSSLGYDVQFRPESLQLLGKKALELILDILSTDPYNKVHTAFLSDIMGFTDQSMCILRNKITESSRVKNRTAFILSVIQDLILLEDNYRQNNVETAKGEPIDLFLMSQQQNSSETKSAGTKKEKHKMESTIKSFFTNWKKKKKKKEEPTASSSSSCIVIKKSLTKLKNRSTEGKNETENDDDVLSLGREVALFIYQWIALVAFDAIQFYSSTRLSLLRRSSP